MKFDDNYNKELIKDNLNHVMYNIEYQDTRELIKDKLKLIKQQLETK